MKTTVVPAQITSVEDRIAGNFTFSQIMFLIIALLIGTAVYVIVPPRSGFTAVKLVLIGLDLILLGGMAIRVDGKIVAQWLVVYLRFFARPKLYVFTKNDLTARLVPSLVREKKKTAQKTIKRKTSTLPSLTFAEQMKLNKLIESPSLSVSFELSKKGGVDVSLTPVKK